MEGFIRVLVLLICGTYVVPLAAQDQWRGLEVKPENRCSPYDKKKQYPYSQSVEDRIVESMGGLIYGPYTGRYFEADTETDIEHIVGSSQAHDSGLCAASASTRKQFASDLLNLTLAAPEVNRCGAGGKCGLDAAEWLPQENKCWFTNRIVEIKSKYSLSVDREEALALESVLSECESVEMVYFTPGRPIITSTISRTDDALSLYDDNGNGRISCKEARSHGIAPVGRQHAAYSYMIDRDNDGVICE